ncbi:MAG: type IV pilus modification PilV family protein [Planctomycetota bacterium]|jgi:type II secretory pathway pseudopilin PulG
MKTNNHKAPIFNLKSIIINLKSKTGFTLIEICIAVFLLGVGLISMLTLFPIGVDSMKKVTQYSKAAILCESAISDLKANDIVSIVRTQTGSNTYPDVKNINQDKLFEDSAANTITSQYSWQAVLENIATGKNLVRAQVAIFRNFNPSKFGTGTADFTNGSDTAFYIPPLPSGLTSKHYIRVDNYKFWYRIDSINAATTTITLEGSFSGETGIELAFTTTDNIIDIYETMFAKH